VVTSELVTTIEPMRSAAAHANMRPSLEQIWAWLAEVPDPEIPVVSVVDLGIVRDVEWSAEGDGALMVTVTPTYSGCPATEVIGHEIRAKLLREGVGQVVLRVQLSPPWTTDWLSEAARAKLREYGIAPPTQRMAEGLDALAASLLTLGKAQGAAELVCPRCGSTHTEMISLFGSTPCKSLHRCIECREPFDHFKCH
jgi:ring-1,2-phenylacetyl-CoA epoxidase subunit PaaD